MEIVPEPCDNNSHIVVLKEEQRINKPSNGENSHGPCLYILLSLMIIFFTCLWTGLFEYHPQISIEAITVSTIDIISSSPSLPPYYASLSAQNLTINFVVENPAPHEVEYKSAVVLISYKGNILWANKLGLYYQQKRERKPVQVHFDNSPVEIRGADVANEMSTTSGYGGFTVDVNGIYNSKKLKVHCRDVKIHQFSSSFTQEITSRFPTRCSSNVPDEPGWAAYS